MIETRVTGRASVWLAAARASIVLYPKDREKVHFFQPVELLKHDKKKQLVCSHVV